MILLSGIFVLGIQMLAAPLLSARIDTTLSELETYETIYQEFPEEECILYCPDCHSACWAIEDDSLLINPIVRDTFPSPSK